MPIAAFAGGAAAFSMAGVPLTLGFFGKDSAYEALLRASDWFPSLLILTVLASIFLGVAGLLAGVAPFWARADPQRHGHEPAPALWLPALALAMLGVVAGVVPSALDRPVTSAATAIAGAPVVASLQLWHGVTPTLFLSLLTLATVAVVYVIRSMVRTRTWKPRRSTEDIYEGVLSALDAVSRVIGPALHSASLRTYVMIIVATSVVLGGVALLSDPSFGSAVPHTPIKVQDVPIIAIILGGAIAATFARSTMSAVLSLGAVGYGVATIFLSFGAPDLAMTQFSVETLTVLIYVLVFRHFRGLGPLSPPLVRGRDALIALAVGTFIGALVLSVATTTTAPRLRDYFAAFGPTLGHGRNIVNVILVDFRAFDTLGEITVLSTAALGVRAMLRMATEERRDHAVVQPIASPIFRTAAWLLMPLLLLFSMFLLGRGHNDPGGGFVGGLIAAAAFSLYAIAFGVDRARHALLLRPLTMLGVGLLIALASGLPAAMRGRPFLTAMWLPGPVPLGTPVLFDIGVFLVVAGVVLMMIFNLAEES
jgi:multicomponent Na+:H+ antiporter subunit A